MSVINMTGKKFGRYTVLRRLPNDKFGNAIWECKCDCGTIKAVSGSSLRKGVTISCGCFHKDEMIARLTKHGLSRSRIRCIYNHMIQRCKNPNDDAYKYYGGRGISVCDEWDSFDNFIKWSMENGYEENLTLDRVDINGNYEPSNCRWVSRKVQQNNRRSNHYFTINNTTKTLAEWCEVYGVPHERVRQRVILKNWDIEEALTTPPQKGHKHHPKSL